MTVVKPWDLAGDFEHDIEKCGTAIAVLRSLRLPNLLSVTAIQTIEELQTVMEKGLHCCSDKSNSSTHKA